MKEKDKNILNNSTFVIIDTMVSFSPELTAAWGLSKVLLGTAIELRKERVFKFFEKIIKKPDLFIPEIMTTQKFQDGLVYSLQNYISERVDKKRDIIFDIFSGYTFEKCNDDFKLELFIHTIKMIGFEELEVFKIFIDGTHEQWLRGQASFTEEDVKKHLKMSLNRYQISKLILFEMKGLKKFENDENAYQVLSSLVNLNLLSRQIDTMGVMSDSYYVSDFGKDFSRYILEKS